MDRPETGLRESKKLATRNALSTAALTLALEHGVDNVRVDAIAAAAGVSPRTYNNYFSSREHAICVALAAERGLRVGAALRARPRDEPLGAAIVAAVLEQYAGEGEPDRSMVHLITSGTALRGEFLRTIAAIEQPLAEAIAERTGTERYARVLAAAVSAAARVATEEWLRPEVTASFAALLLEALAFVVPTEDDA